MRTIQIVLVLFFISASNSIAQKTPIDKLFDEYTTLLVVKEEDTDLRMMIKEENGKIVEFLMLGGGDDDILISIMGNVDLNSISKISSAAMEMQELEDAGKTDKK